jgi:hypothetical protein
MKSKCFNEALELFRQPMGLSLHLHSSFNGRLIISIENKYRNYRQCRKMTEMKKEKPQNGVLSCLSSWTFSTVDGHLSLIHPDAASVITELDGPPLTWMRKESMPTFDPKLNTAILPGALKTFCNHDLDLSKCSCLASLQ